MVEKNDEKNQKINEHRQEIDIVDDEILLLLQKRIALSTKIAFLKNALNTAIYNPERERDIIGRLLKKNNAAKEAAFLQKNVKNTSHVELPPFLGDEVLRAIFSEIIAACRQSVVSTHAGFLGPEGSFSHLAALEIFGTSASLKSHRTISSLFQSVARREDKMAVVPIENTLGGIVGQSIDGLANENVYIVYEFFLPIHLTLLSREKDLKKIKVVYSHPQALTQAKNWLSGHLPWAELVETPSTSQAAGKAVIEAKTACIGQKKLASLHPELSILEQRIEDSEVNTTRFVVISADPFVGCGKNDMTTLVVSIKDKPGTLSKILNLFSQNGINLTNIFSRPSKKKIFDYIFFIDFLGNTNDPKVKETLSDISEMVTNFKLLGSYPRGVSLNS